MAKEFTRKVRNTTTEEPLYTNTEGDILATNDDSLYIRRKSDYHCLTDNIKTVTSNGSVSHNKKENNVHLTVDTDYIKDIESKNKSIIV